MLTLPESETMNRREELPIPLTTEEAVKLSKSVHIAFTLKIHPDGHHSPKHEYHVKIFKDGSAKEFIKWHMAFQKLEHEMPLCTNQECVETAKMLLNGTALMHYESAKQIMKVQQGLLNPDKPTFQQVMEEMGNSNYFSAHATRKQ